MAAVFTALVCAFDGCFELAVTRCECCAAEAPFCEEHGSPGGDLEREGIAIAYPAACFACGGFNADA